MELPKRYKFKESEKKWQLKWAEDGTYKFDEKSKKEMYSVDTPPPTVSGAMHIGHAFSYSQQDFIVRYKRMRGYNVFYPFGTDDNGLPTEKLVEKKKKVKSTKMDRNDFIDLCQETVKELKPEFVRPWKELAISCDFEESYSTIDEHCQKTSQLSFIELLKKGRAYQEESPVSWCPTCQTAIAQAEFESCDMKSHFNDIVFKHGSEDLVIATTRPELIPACVALFVNPEDVRYKKLLGKFATVPLFDYEVPIMADESVALDKGTGLMMVCTFGDKEDIEKWHKYKLGLRVAIDKNGVMNDMAGKYKGLKLKEARAAILEDLEKEGKLLRQQKIEHAVNLHERCGTEIEFLKTRQWFIKVLDKKQELIDAGNSIAWYPKHMQVRYNHWVENLNWDWCVSRQRHYGVPIPIWYCKKCGEIITPDKKDLPVNPMRDNPKNKCSCGSDEFIGESDVFDTWATSSVSPQVVTDKFNDPEGFEKKYPMSMRPQAHDIIRTWAFYTIVKGVFGEGEAPWKEIVISGHALDPKGKKMSKSKGNVVDPLKMMDLYGADPLRFWAAGSKLGEDLPFQDKDLVTGKKMVNKLWNASKFCLMHIENYEVTNRPRLKIMDRWIMTKLHRLIRDCTETFDNYEYSRTKADVENFFWNTFCDNYLEIVKDRLYNPDIFGEDETNGARNCLYKNLNAVLKMMAPIMPHITEEIYQLYFAEKEGIKSIHNSSWPEWNEVMIDKNAGLIGDIVVDIVGQVRKAKSDNGHPLNTPIERVKVFVKEEFFSKPERTFADLKAATKSDHIDVFKVEEDGVRVEVEFKKTE